ncbi:MAG: hypothetical protein PHO83_03640 [Geobacteraceae bacterium]|nr:hypothetical protein [Geobacteraceae bacterium]
MPIMKMVAVFSLMLLCASTVFAEDKEVLLGVATDFSASTITFDVVGSGCTDKSSFRMDFSDKVLTVFRTRRDTCKAMPEKTSLTYTLDELGINPHKPFAIGNYFLVNENLAGVVVVPEGRHESPCPGR